MGHGLVIASIRRECPDARMGATWRAVSVEGYFFKRWCLEWNRSTVCSMRCVFEACGAEAVGGAEFKLPKVAPYCVYRLLWLRIHIHG
jgi:hypothetical protein